MPRGRPKKEAPGNVAAPMRAGRTNKIQQPLLLLQGGWQGLQLDVACSGMPPRWRPLRGA
jgi:hypothetical protein